jgi:hypothetical protein
VLEVVLVSGTLSYADSVCEQSNLEVELSSVRQAFNNLQAKYDALSDAYASAVADVSSHQARISALQRTVDHLSIPLENGVASPKSSMKSNSTSSTQYVRQELTSMSHDADGVGESVSSLSSASGSSCSDGASPKEASSTTKRRASLDAPLSAEDKLILEAGS